MGENLCQLELDKAFLVMTSEARSIKSPKNVLRSDLKLLFLKDTVKRMKRTQATD